MSSENKDGGYKHWHEFGRTTSPGGSIPDKKAPDSGPGGLSSGSVKGDRPTKHDPAPGGMQPNEAFKSKKPKGS